MEDFDNIETELNELDLYIVAESQPVIDDNEESERDELETSQPENINDPEMIADMIQMGVAELFPMYPTLEKVYTRERCLDLATKSCAVADKHNLNVLGFLAKYMEEIMLGFTCVQLVKATYKAIDHDMKAEEIKQKVDDAENAGITE